MSERRGGDYHAEIWKPIFLGIGLVLVGLLGYGLLSGEHVLMFTWVKGGDTPDPPAPRVVESPAIKTVRELQAANVRVRPLPKESPRQVIVPAPKRPPLPEYARLRDGMTYADVVRILGADGRKKMAAKTPEGEKVTYEWPLQDVLTIKGVFVDEHLVEWEATDGVADPVAKRVYATPAYRKPTYNVPVQNTTPEVDRRIRVPPIQPLP